MGLSVVNGDLDPKASNNPLGTPAELEAEGYDLAEVHSCSVKVMQNGVMTTRGCMHAEKCSALFGKQGLRFGGFGPPNAKPGTAGKGREYVPYSIRFADGAYKEDYTWCHIFVGGSLYDTLVSQGAPGYNGDKVRLLGKAGEGGPEGKGAVILIQDMLPVDPNNNRTKNYKMEQVEKVVTVAAAPRLRQVAAGLRARNLAETADEDDFLRSLEAESKVAGVTPTGTVGGLGGDTTALEVASAEEAAPMKRRSAREKD